MNKRILIIASLFGLFAVALGAFGAHGLRSHISAGELENWKTGVSYQFYHSLALLFLALLPSEFARLRTLAVYAFTFGILLFSGSLYLLSTRPITGFYWSFLGPITPVGGLLLIIGWLSLLLTALRRK